MRNKYVQQHGEIRQLSRRCLTVNDCDVLEVEVSFTCIRLIGSIFLFMALPCMPLHCAVAGRGKAPLLEHGVDDED